MKPFSLLSRYLSRSFLISFGVGLICVLIIILLFDFAELQRRARLTDMSFSVKLNMVFLRAPYFIEQVIPFLAFGTAIFTFWRLNRSNELIIFRATGVSLWRVILPICLSALMVGLFDLTTFNPLSTAMLERYEKLDKRYFSNSKEDIKIESTGLWLSEKMGHNQVIYRAKRVDLDKVEFQDVNAIITSSDNKFIERIDAKFAQIQGNQLELRDGWIVMAGQVAVPFSKKTIETSLDRNIIQKMKISHGVFSFWKLPSYIKLLDTSGLQSLKYRMQWHSMIAYSIWVGAMIILAAGFSCRPLRQGKSILIIFVGLIVGFLLYFFKDMTFALGSYGGLPPLIAAWLPLVVTVMVGAVLVFNQEDG